MFSYILVVSRDYVLLMSICPMLKIGKLPIIASYIYLQFYLKLYCHVPEKFWRIKIFPVLLKKILSFACLVFKNENKWILKL